MILFWGGTKYTKYMNSIRHLKTKQSREQVAITQSTTRDVQRWLPLRWHTAFLYLRLCVLSFVYFVFVYMCNCVYVYEGLGHYPYQASWSDRCVALLFSLSPRSARHGDQTKAENIWYFLIDIILPVQQDHNVVNIMSGLVPCKWLRCFLSFCYYHSIQIFV